MAELLTGLGAEVEPPKNAGENGWDCHFVYQGRSLWFQVSLIERYLLVVEDNSWSLGKLLGKISPAYVEAMSKLADALAADPRFHDVRRFCNHEVHTGAKGAPRPVTAA